MALLLKLLTTEKYNGGNWLFKSNCEQTVWPDDLENNKMLTLAFTWACIAHFAKQKKFLILEIPQNQIKKETEPIPRLGDE